MVSSVSFQNIVSKKLGFEEKTGTLSRTPESQLLLGIQKEDAGGNGEMGSRI